MEIPEELFDGWAVLRQVEKTTGNRMKPEEVSDVLDAVVSLIKERIAT